MKIFERFFISYENILLFTILHLSNNVFFSSIFMQDSDSSSISQKFSPYGRIRNTHFQRYQGLAVAYYGCALECLVNERLANVKFSG